MAQQYYFDEGNNMFVGDGTAGTLLHIYGAAGTFRGIKIYSGSVARYQLYADNTAESGSDVGSDFVLAIYSDAGAYLNSGFRIKRETGYALFQNGTSTVPGISFISDPDTGIGAPTANVLELFGGGDSYLKIYGGTASPGVVWSEAVLRIYDLNDDWSYIDLYRNTSTPANPTSDVNAHIYIRGGNFIFQWNDAGTTRYKYLDLTGTGVTWVHSTTAPT